ncbi:hypothetical protein KAS08_04025 [Candidatus Pacearchaeota archaeon]|nr:hypothetical protein [Candidatus Pacearchaeota archaeon]
MKRVIGVLFLLIIIGVFASAACEPEGRCVNRNFFSCGSDEVVTDDECTELFFECCMPIDGPLEEICCKSYGYGAYMVLTNINYEFTYNYECQYPEGHTGGGMEIVNNECCETEIPDGECCETEIETEIPVSGSFENYNGKGHNTNEVFINVSGNIVTLQEMFDNALFYGYEYSNPDLNSITLLQYEFTSDILVSTDLDGEITFLEALNSPNFIIGGTSVYSDVDNARHLGTNIIFENGKSLQELIAYGEVCVSDINEECGGSNCLNPGIVLCNGTCVDVTSKEDGIRCGDNNEGYCSSGLCDTSLLVNADHDSEQCEELGGGIVYDDDDKYCKFSGSSCPGDWSRYGSWSTTSNHKCSESCGSSCNTGYHSWENKGRETCGYYKSLTTKWISLIPPKIVDVCLYIKDEDKTCYAYITEVGCY